MARVLPFGATRIIHQELNDLEIVLVRKERELRCRQALIPKGLSVTAGALAVFPVLMVFAFAQRNIVQGLTMTGMKS